jgi:hypothetical protein
MPLHWVKTSIIYPRLMGPGDPDDSFMGFATPTWYVAQISQNTNWHELQWRWSMVRLWKPKCWDSDRVETFEAAKAGAQATFDRWLHSVGLEEVPDSWRENSGIVYRDKISAS